MTLYRLFLALAVAPLVSAIPAKAELPTIPRYGNFTVENESITFPAGENVVLDVRKPPYHAKGDGVADDTFAIQSALNDAILVENSPFIVYLPNGIYRISDTLKWAGKQTRVVLQGQSERGTIIQLRDRCPGFTSPATPRELIWTGDFPPQRFRNAIRNLTIDTGKENPGAIGLRFNASNQGVLREVTIRSGDGSGTIGLDMGYTGDVGPLLVKNLTVVGFDVGIYTAHSSAGQVLEGVTLRNQKVYGWVNDGQAISARALHTQLSVPALLLKQSGGLFVLIDSLLEGQGAAQEHPAITGSAPLFVRNTRTPGYRTAIENTLNASRDQAGPDVIEYSSAAPTRLFPSPDKSLNLPIEETPEIPYEDPSKWVSVLDYEPIHVEVDDVVYGKNAYSEAEALKENKSFKTKVWDYTAAIQSAIDSGASTVYFPTAPKGKPYAVLGTVHVRGKVSRIIGLENTFQPNHKGRIPYGGEWIVEDGEAPTVTVERFDWIYPNPIFRVRTKRPVVVSSVVGPRYDIGEGATVYMEDVVPTIHIAPGARVWARQFNTEYTDESRHFINDDMKRPPHPGAPPESHGNLNNGGTFWILGIKSEGNGTIISTINGAKTEVVGGLIYANKDGRPAKKMFIVEDGSLSFSIREMASRNEPFNALHETRQGQTKTYPPTPGGLVTPLFTAYIGTPGSDQPAEPEPSLPPGQGTGLTGHYFEGDTFQTLQTTRLDPVIDFDWSQSAPDLVPTEKYSVRWTGEIEARQTGLYNFPLSAENMRLLIGDTVVNSAWSPPVRYRNGSIQLQAGKRYPIVLERRGIDKAKVDLRWGTPAGNNEIVPTTQLYPAQTEPPTVSLTAPRGDIPEGDKMDWTLTRTGDTSQPLEVRFLPRVEASMPMQMRFAQRGDALPGLDYEPLPDAVTIPAGQNSITIPFVTIDNDRYQEQRVVMLEPDFSSHYRISGKGTKVWIKDNDSPPIGTGTGLKGEYFAGQDFTDLKTTRIDERVRFDQRMWDQKSPAEGIDPKNGYSVRWTGYLQPQFSEEYTIKFDSTTYGAAKVTLGDTVLIDAQPRQNYRTARIRLEAGKKYPIQIDYDVRNHYSSMAILSWSSESQFEQFIPTTQLYPAD